MSSAPDWAHAPPGFDWLAQDADGRWFWYRTEPIPSWGGGVWRANSRNQQPAKSSTPSSPNPQWMDTLQQRPPDKA